MDRPSIPGYDVLSRIGSGGSAQVWRARRVADDLHVALKIVPTGTERVSPVLREAGILARVRHQHVIRLYDVLPVPGTEGRPHGVALAMELAEGGSLAEVLGARDHLSPGELVTVCSPLAEALAELHRAGVVHGDISAGNVLFRADGMPLLADLGVSRLAGEPRAVVHGTDGMVAPEVIEGFEPTAESDVYSLGALCWRCLIGEPPGWVGTRPELAEVRPELPEALVQLVTACLSGEPADRPEAEEVAAGVFAAAPPEPIALAPGADPAAGLTQRIRADLRARTQPGAAAGGVGDDAAEHASGRDEQGPGSGRWSLLRRRRVSARQADRSRTGHRAIGRRLGLVVGSCAAVAVIALLVSSGLGFLLGSGSAADSAGADGAALTAERHEGPEPTSVTAPETGAPAVDTAPPASSSDATSGPSSEAVPTDSTTSASSKTDLTEVAQHLLDARAAAWRSGDPDDLESAHLLGSPAYQQEQASFAAADDLDVRYDGLEFTVRDVQVLATGPERAVLEVEVQRSTYQEVTPTGRSTYKGQLDVVELELRRAHGEWRIWGWAAAAGQEQAGRGSGEETGAGQG